MFSCSIDELPSITESNGWFYLSLKDLPEEYSLRAPTRFLDREKKSSTKIFDFVGPPEAERFPRQLAWSPKKINSNDALTTPFNKVDLCTYDGHVYDYLDNHRHGHNHQLNQTQLFVCLEYQKGVKSEGHIDQAGICPAFNSGQKE